MNKTIIKEILIKFFSWRILVSLLAIPAIFILPLHPGFTAIKDSNFLLSLSQMWANFEGQNNLILADIGQAVTGKYSLLYSFFPVYPWLIKTVNLIIHNFIASGLLVSNLAFLISLFCLYKLFLEDYKPKIAKLALFLILIFPTSFFFGAIYSESVFFLFTILTFLFARKKDFLFAGIFAFLASLTQVSGLLLWPALAIEYSLAHAKNKKFLNTQLLWLSIPFLGLISFLRYQLVRTGASLFEVIGQALIGPNQMVDKMILLHQVFYRYFKMIIFMDHFDPLFYTILLEVLLATIFLVLIIFTAKKIRPSYWTYCLLAFFLPTFTGTFSGFPRYLLVLFPLFGFLASFLEKHHPYLRYLYIVISVVFSIFAISFFTRGYFVA